MGCLQGRGIVGSVAGYGHDLAVGLQRFDKAFLVHWACACNDFQVFNPTCELVVGHLGNFGTCGYVPVRVGSVVPEAYLAPDLFCSAGSVAGHDLDLYAGVGHPCHSVGDIGADRIGDRGNAEESHVAAGDAPVFNWVFAIGKFLVGKSESAHRLVLVAEQQSVQLLARNAGSIGAKSEHDFGRSFDIKHGASGSGADNRGHVFALGRERKLVNARHAVAAAFIVDAFIVEPEQEGAFSRVAEN